MEFYITEKQLDQLYDMAYDRANWNESPHDNTKLNQLYDMIKGQEIKREDFAE
jgi:hypothetical protein